MKLVLNNRYKGTKNGTYGEEYKKRTVNILIDSTT